MDRNAMEKMMLDTHQLNIFLTAASALNFTVASRQLHISKSNLNRHIEKLEQHFGKPLFIREGEKLYLTDAGVELMSIAQEMVTMSQNIEEKMASLKGKGQNTEVL